MMSSQADTRWNNIKSCMRTIADTLEILADTPDTSLFTPLSLTTRSLAAVAENIKTGQTDCASLLEDTYQVLDALIGLHVESKTGNDLPPSVLDHVGNLVKTVNMVYSFVDAQQTSGRILRFFRQNERNALYKACRTGLQEALDNFKVDNIAIKTRVEYAQEMAAIRHQEILALIEAHSDATGSDRDASINQIFSSVYSSSNSLTMLPSKPKIFHGRASELSDILDMFKNGIPRIAILGAAGMGKTSLAREVLHQEDVTSAFGENSFFVSCESASSAEELVVLIGAHLGLSPARALRKQVLQHFEKGKKALLVLDNFESVWDALAGRTQVEDFLSALTDIEHLALMITMRGAERPSQVRWTRPFLPPLKPLADNAARQIFADITDDVHEADEVDRILRLTDNLPLAVTLLSHLVDSEGCSAVLDHWEREKTALLSDGVDKRSNLDLSISLSLTSPRVTQQSLQLLSLLSILPDGLSDIEFAQANLPISLESHAALLRTALAYSTDQKRIQVLLPIREYVQKYHPPTFDLVEPMFQHYRQLTKICTTQWGTISNSVIATRMHTNLANMQKIIICRLKEKTLDRTAIAEFILSLNTFTRRTVHGNNPLMAYVPDLLHPQDYRLRVKYISEWISDSRLPPPSTSTVDQALENLDLVDDPSISAALLYALAWRNLGSDELNAAKNMCHRGLALLTPNQNSDLEASLLNMLASLKFRDGDCIGGKAVAKRAYLVAQISGRFSLQAEMLRTSARCSLGLGEFQLSIHLCHKAMDCLNLCGLSWCHQHQFILSTQAEALKWKSEYTEAQRIYDKLNRSTLAEQPYPYQQAVTLYRVAELDVILGAPRHKIQRNLDIARNLFHSIGVAGEMQFCDFIQADLDAREQETQDQTISYEKCLKKWIGQDVEVESLCLERLALGSHNRMTSWAFILIAHSFKFKRNLGLHKGLQSLAQHFLLQDDAKTAESLFILALDGFTWMDVHRSRAECMLTLGRIAESNGNFGKAKEFWSAAIPLFERSSQVKLVREVKKRIEQLGRVDLESITHHTEELSQF